jgi:putative acetyltransferase
MTEIREERVSDIASIRAVNIRAFGRDQEANIVDALRTNAAVVLSLVASREGDVVGHILYSPVTIGDVTAAALGPMAVVPECQRQGIGSALVRAGQQRLQELGCPLVVVVGHPAFYPRFGFEPARARGLICEWPVPDNVFMLAMLSEAKRDLKGLAKYRSEFSTVL